MTLRPDPNGFVMPDTIKEFADRLRDLDINTMELYWLDYLPGTPRANHYTLKTIRTRLGSKYADHVAASRSFLQWETPNGARRLYYCPECTEKQRLRSL